MGASHTRTYTENKAKTNNEPTKDGGLENHILFERSDFRFQFATFFLGKSTRSKVGPERLKELFQVGF